MAKLSNRAIKWSTLETASLHGTIMEMQLADEKIIDLTIGISNLPIPKEGEAAAIKAITKNDIPYTPISGSTELKEAILNKLERENNISVNKTNVIATTGAKQAIFQALFCLTNPEDEIVLFRPNWPAYTQIAAMLKLTPRFIDLNEINSLSIRKANPKLKVLILNNPHNPTGHIFSNEELQKIASFAKKNNLYILSDESYEKLNYEGSHQSFINVNKNLKNQTVTVFSASQSFSMMGWRLGYAVAESEIIQAMESLQSSITAATSAVTQAAVAQTLKVNEKYTKNLTNEFKQRRDQVFPKLSQIHWLRCELPKSGPYFWADIQKLTKDSAEFCCKLLQQKKVALMPGEAFGSPGWIRIAFNVQNATILEEAFKKISDFGESYHEKS